MNQKFNTDEQYWRWEEKKERTKIIKDYFCENRGDGYYDS